jgi:2-hydroxychromene-2-carboxylate isomerase
MSIMIDLHYWPAPDCWKISNMLEESALPYRLMAGMCRCMGVDGDYFLSGFGQTVIKEQLKANSDQVIRRGGFGSPMIFLGEDMYFGNDRLSLVKTTMLRTCAASPLD